MFIVGQLDCHCKLICSSCEMGNVGLKASIIATKLEEDMSQLDDSEQAKLLVALSHMVQVMQMIQRVTTKGKNEYWTSKMSTI